MRNNNNKMRNHNSNKMCNNNDRMRVPPASRTFSHVLAAERNGLVAATARARLALRVAAARARLALPDSFFRFWRLQGAIDVDVPA